jgi:hypothetical protein
LGYKVLVVINEFLFLYKMYRVDDIDFLNEVQRMCGDDPVLEITNKQGVTLGFRVQGCMLKCGERTIHLGSSIGAINVSGLLYDMLGSGYRLNRLEDVEVEICGEKMFMKNNIFKSLNPIDSVKINFNNGTTVRVACTNVPPPSVIEYRKKGWVGFTPDYLVSASYIIHATIKGGNYSVGTITLMVDGKTVRIEEILVSVGCTPELVMEEENRVMKRMTEDLCIVDVSRYSIKVKHHPQPSVSILCQNIMRGPTLFVKDLATDAPILDVTLTRDGEILWWNKVEFEVKAFLHQEF